jgi:hypothetical protein
VRRGMVEPRSADPAPWRAPRGKPLIAGLPQCRPLWLADCSSRSVLAPRCRTLVRACFGYGAVPAPWRAHVTDPVPELVTLLQVT